VFRAIPNCDVVGIVSRGGKSAQNLASEFAVPSFGTDWRHLARKTNANACVVAVSHDMSELVCREIIDAGFHVLAEKPVALSSAEIFELAERAQQRSVVAIAAVNRRFYPGITEAVDALKMLGDIFHVSINAPDNPESRRIEGKHAGFVCDNWIRMNTIHAVDLLRMIGGEVTEMFGFRRVQVRPDHQTISVCLRFECGILGSFVLPGGLNTPWELRMAGEDAEVIAKPLEKVQLKIGNSNSKPLPSNPNNSASAFKLGLFEQAHAFVDAVHQGIVSWPCSDFADHAKTMKLIEEIEQLPSIT
ncbi:MAG: Gfo/Idh/MocA family oxidoreductase, partial [Planctomycetaceae bacterium]|nr:Gfo/Idh/MocA family oxidoreductase [Planctomycetaceae bacterium]